MKRWEPIAYPGPENDFGAATHRNFNQSTGERGSWLDAAGYQQVLDEIAAATSGNGYSESAADSTQLLASIGINLGLAGGSANALTATIPGGVILPALTAGMRFTIQFGATANSGAATLDLAGFTADPPAIAIVRNDSGAPLEGGELIGWGQLLFDGVVFRLLAVPRLRTPRVAVPAGGITVSAKDEYTTFVMDLAVRQVFTLPAPASVPIGFRCTLETSNQPSGFQTAYVNAGGGANILYRASGATNFYLIGGGEVFEFVNTGTLWLARLVSQPAGVVLYRTAAGQPGTVSMPSSYGNVNLDTSSGSPGLFQIAAATIRVPVAGVYNISANIVGYNNVPAWDNLDVCIFDNTSGLLTQAVNSLAVFNNFQVTPRVQYTSYYPAGTLLLFAARAPGGSGVLLGNASTYSVILTGR